MTKSYQDCVRSGCPCCICLILTLPLNRGCSCCRKLRGCSCCHKLSPHLKIGDKGRTRPHSVFSEIYLSKIGELHLFISKPIRDQYWTLFWKKTQIDIYVYIYIYKFIYITYIYKYSSFVWNSSRCSLLCSPK